MDDAIGEELLHGLRAGTLASLDHEGHLRVAWTLARRHGLVEVLEILAPLLRSYAASKDHADAYHETTTFAFACLIHERVRRLDESHDWDTFKGTFPELFDRALLDRYYARDTMRSSAARLGFIFPDRVCPID